MNEMVTLVIPTKNRSDFLVRLLHYYRDLGFQGCISIGDSSNAYHVEQTKSAIRSLEGKLNITYREQCEYDYRLWFKQLGESVSTPYTVFLGDDDFLVPNGLEQCIAFLEKNQDYAAAHGIRVTFMLDRSGPYGQFRVAYRVAFFGQQAIEAGTASQRLMDYLTNPFVSVFCVHRTEVWRVMCRDVTLLVDRAFADDLLPSCLSAIRGKIKRSDCLYLANQEHDQQARDPNIYPNIFDRITNPAWAPSYQLFRDCLAEELARQDGISGQKAREVVKEAYWSLLARAMKGEWEALYTRRPAKPRSRLREAARRVPGLRRAWRAVRALAPRKEDEFSLPALLRPSCPYHADFTPIYRAVTNPPPRLAE